MAAGPVDALRVSQLDASELDHELIQLTKSQISHIFKFHRTTLLSRFDPEIRVTIKLLLWKFALYDQGATLGQQILGIQYGQSKGGKPGVAITGREKILYGLLVVVCPWLKERVATLLSYLRLSHMDSQVGYEFMTRELMWHGFSANLAADSNFTCPQCGHPVISEENIQGVKSHINPGDVKK